MTHADADPPMLVHGVAWRAATGETACGDHWVVESNGRTTLLAVIDGLGHGEHAETAAHAAAEAIRHAPHGDLPVVLSHAHDALRLTRGAAVSLAAITPGRLHWLAVGNVQGVLRRHATGATTRLVTRGGIVGSRLPRLQATEQTLESGDVLAMFTDGIHDDAARGLTSRWEPRLLAPWLLDNHANGTDDALMLVARHGRSET